MYGKLYCSSACKQQAWKMRRAERLKLRPSQIQGSPRVLLTLVNESRSYSGLDQIALDSYLCLCAAIAAHREAMQAYEMKRLRTRAPAYLVELPIPADELTGQDHLRASAIGVATARGPGGKRIMYVVVGTD